MATNVRVATMNDVDDIVRIYNEGIRGRGATFETAERVRADIEPWFSGQHPLLVAERDARVVGWVHSSPYRPRACYAGIGDFSVYVAADAKGMRVGDALMHAFLPACEAIGLWKILSRIFPENHASRALCARHGFREVGVYEKHARLDGVWRDVVIVERLLSHAD